MPRYLEATRIISAAWDPSTPQNDSRSRIALLRWMTRLVPNPVHKRPQFPRPRGMPQLPQRLGFDLADAFAGYCERLPDFFERVLAAIFQAEAHLDYFFFAGGQRAEDLSGLVFEVHVDHGFGGRNYGAVFDKVAEV